MSGKLKPCPFCGGEAVIEEVTNSLYMQRMKIVCGGCGVVLDWTQEYILSGFKKHIGFGKDVTERVATNINAIDAWNRRANEKGGAE